MNAAYRQISTIIYFLTFHDGPMNFGDNSVGARGIFLELGNDGTGFGDSHVCSYRKFSLRIQELAIVTRK